MPEGPDICLGWIPGVSQACCGHGKRVPFVHLAFQSDAPAESPHVIIAGEDATTFFELVKRGEHVGDYDPRG
jgi:hypothetical protein